MNFKEKGLSSFLAIYIIITIYLMQKNYTVYVNIINPIYWGIVLIYIRYDIKKDYIRYNNNRKKYRNMIIISSIYVVTYFYLGFIFGYTKSPYSHKVLHIIKNVIIQIFPIIGIEMARFVIANRNKNNKKALIIITLILILLEINYNKINNLYPNKKELFEYLCAETMPTILNSFIYTFLSIKGTYLLTIIYRIFKEAEIILLPILPNINWFVEGAISIISTAIIYGLYRYKFTIEEERTINKKENFFSKLSYGVVMILSFSLVCFMLGLFKHEPITILSNSMVPTFSRADIVIYKKLSESELKELSKDSIIVYTLDEQNIVHRIVDKVNEEGTVKYQTKGDSNNIADFKLVDINQIKGVYCFHIKYLGYPSVMLYEYLNSQ